MIKKLLFIIFISMLHSSYGQTFEWGNKQLNSGDTIVTHQVVFYLAKSEITEYSKPFLDSLVNFLKTYNDVAVEITNHGDIRTSKEVSVLITQRRAEAIKEYLMKSGVEIERINAIGYEGDHPVFDWNYINKLKTMEQKEKAHAKNRRTEIIIKIQSNSE